jgi:hypothetical protein
MSYANFCNGLNKAGIVSLYQQLRDHSLRIPSTEIWCNQTVDHILSGIKYFYDTGAFEHRDVALLLLNQVQHLLNAVHQYVKAGYMNAAQKVPFRMYVCEVDTDYNILLATENALPYYTITHVLNNRFGTPDRTLCDSTHRWVVDLKAKSTRISGLSSIKEREQFFRSAEDKIKHLTDKITAGRSALYDDRMLCRS